MRFAGWAEPGNIFNIQPSRPRPGSFGFGQVVQLDKSGYLDRTFNRSGTVHLPGAMVEGPWYMTEMDQAGTSFASVRVPRRVGSPRVPVIGIKSNGALVPLPAAAGVVEHYAGEPFTLMADGSLARLDLPVAVRYFHPSGAPWAGSAAVATLPRSPRARFDKVVRLYSNGDLYNYESTQLGRLTRYTAGTVAIQPRTPRPVLNVASGFQEHTLDITNTSALDLPGFRLHAAHLPPGISLWNCSEITRYPQPRILNYLTKLKRGETITITLQFTRGASIKPYYRSTAAAEAFDVPGSILSQLHVPGKATVVVASRPGTRYYPEYSDDNGSTWNPAATPILAAGTRIAWEDQGKPQTASKPPETRRYRFISGGGQ